MSAAALGIAKAVFFPLIDKWFSKESDKTAAKAELTATIYNYKGKELEIAGDVIKTEATGNARQRNWRPDLMYLIMQFLRIYGIYLPIYNFMLRPILNIWIQTEEGAGLLPIIDPVLVWQGIPPQLWTFLQISVGGYVVSRGVEKSLDIAVNGESTVTEAVGREVKKITEVGSKIVKTPINMFDKMRGRSQTFDHGPQETLQTHTVGGRQR